MSAERGERVSLLAVHKQTIILEDTATGRATVNFNSYFGVAPFCTCTSLEENTSGIICAMAGVATTTNVEVRTRADLTNALTDESFNITCTGAK